MLKNLFDISRKELKKLGPIANKVLALESEFEKLTDDELKAKTEWFKERISNGETMEEVMVEAYAVVREASTRVLKMTPFRVQVMGAVTIHQGNIAEMKTGEGKTLTAVMPAYLNALEGNGVHIVTVNEYLARREAEGEIGVTYVSGPVKKVTKFPPEMEQTSQLGPPLASKVIYQSRKATVIPTVTPPPSPCFPEASTMYGVSRFSNSSSQSRTKSTIS